MFSDLLLRAKVECGIASVQDLRNNSLEDRMESFVLSETLKVCSQPHVYPQIINFPSIFIYCSMKAIPYTTMTPTTYLRRRAIYYHLSENICRSHLPRLDGCVAQKAHNAQHMRRHSLPVQMTHQDSMSASVPDQTLTILVSSSMRRFRMGTKCIGIRTVGARSQSSSNM